MKWKVGVYPYILPFHFYGLPKNLSAADGALMPSRARFCRRKTAHFPAPKRPEK